MKTSRFSHVCTVCISAAVSLVVSTAAANATPPSIDYQPRSQTVILFQQAAFGVIARGPAPLSYQWSKDGVPIAGATNDQIVLAHAQFSDAGLYSVIVSNLEGSVASTEAGLTVNSPVAGDIDFSFVSEPSINGPVERVAVQPDGRVLICGWFTTVNRVARGRIARLNADGTTDHTFMDGLSGADGVIKSVAVQSDGKVLIGGLFSTVNGVNRTNIARLNADGTLDSGFQKGIGGVGGILSGSIPSVEAVTVQSDGKVIIGGEFTKVNGVIRNRIARLNADGTLDSSFQNGLYEADGSVGSIAVQGDGKVLVGGSFIMGYALSRSALVRLNADGSLDNGFRSELTGAGRASVNSISLQSDGKVLIAGWFTTVKGVGRTNIARLNADGTVDSSFQNGLSGANDGVSSVAVQRDGRVLITGGFTAVNAVSRNGIARLNADGTLDNGFQDGLPGAFYPLSLAVQSDGKVLIAGSFSSVNGKSRNSIARLNTDGTTDSGFQNAFPGANYGSGRRFVSSVVIQRDGKVLIGGKFWEVTYTSRTGIVRINPDGTLDRAFHSGMAEVNHCFHDDCFPMVNSVGVQTDGKVLVGGWFATVNGESRNNIARLNADGTLDGGFQNGLLGTDGSVVSVAAQDDGKVLIGGGFSTVNGESRAKIARLNVDGTLDSGFQNGLSGANDRVSSVVVQSDGKVLVGGWFTTVNGESRNNIARLNADGTLDSSFLNGLSGVSGTVNTNLNPYSRLSSVAVQRDGKVLIGGLFTTVNGASRNNIARFNADGTLDSSFENRLSGVSGTVNTNLNPFSHVSSVAVQRDGKVLIGGLFTTVNGASRNNIARLNADGTLDSSFENELSGAELSGDDNNGVFSLAVQADGKVLIGGFFTTYNGVPTAGFARLWGEAVPPGLTIAKLNTAAIISWPATATPLELESTANLTMPNSWSSVVASAVINNARISVAVPLSTGNRFFRPRSIGPENPPP